MNSSVFTPTLTNATPQRVEFFRLPAPGKRDPHFGLSRGWSFMILCATISGVRHRRRRQRLWALCPLSRNCRLIFRKHENASS